MAFTTWNGDGTQPFPTTGGGPSGTGTGYVRKAISAVDNTTPIKVHSTAHGYNTGDTVEQEGTSGTADGLFIITKFDANSYTLNGTTANGAATTGYAIDYEIQPAFRLPADGTLADIHDVVAMGEGLSNAIPFLYRRVGKMRLINQYAFSNDWPTTPFSTNPWSVNSPFTSATKVALATSTLTLQSMSDTSLIPSVIAAGDLLEFTTSFTAGTETVSGSPQGNFEVGFGFVQGGALLSGLFGIPSALVPVLYTLGTTYMTPVCLTGSIVASNAGGLTVPASSLSVCLFGRVDAMSGGTALLDMFGQWNILINQWRAN